MKIGLFGGSFDPIHYGHIRPVQEARLQLGLERVIYLPTARPPHKPDRRFAPAHVRYTMVELALLSEPGLYASPHELTPGTPAYTVETVEHFWRSLPDAALHLLIGSDSFAELDTWKRWRELVELVELAVLLRPGATPEDLARRSPPEIAALAASARVHFVANTPVGVSSTELRRVLREGGEPAPDALPGLVLQYLRKYSVYR